MAIRILQVNHVDVDVMVDNTYQACVRHDPQSPVRFTGVKLLLRKEDIKEIKQLCDSEYY